MQGTIEHHTVFTLGKKSWKIPSNHQKVIGNQTFCKLERNARGFALLVFHENDHIPKPLPKGYSLVASLGYDKLREARKLATIQSHVDNELQGKADVSELFRAKLTIAAEKKLKKTTRTKQAKYVPSPVDIVVDHDVTITCLTHAYHHEDLWVLLDAETITQCVVVCKEGCWDSSRIVSKREKGSLRRVKNKHSGKTILYKKLDNGKLKRHSSEPHGDDDLPMGGDQAGELPDVWWGDQDDALSHGDTNDDDIDDPDSDEARELECDTVDVDNNEED